MGRTAVKKRKKSTAREVVDEIKSSVEDTELIERRRAQITKAAISVFIRLGYHVSTIRDVSKEAKVSIGMIYQYIRDKEDLLLLALIEILDDYKRQIPPVLETAADPFERFVLVVRKYCEVHNASPDATVLAYRETASLSKERRDLIKQLEQETNLIILDSINDCVKAGIFQEEIDADLFCYQIIMFSHTWALKMWHFRGRIDWETYVERGLKLMLGGVITTKGARRLKSLSGPCD